MLAGSYIKTGVLSNTIQRRSMQWLLIGHILDARCRAPGTWPLDGISRAFGSPSCNAFPSLARHVVGVPLLEMVFNLQDAWLLDGDVF